MTRVASFLLLCLYLAAVSGLAQQKGLRGQDLEPEEPEEREERGLQDAFIAEGLPGCVLSDLTQSSSLQPASASLPTSYKLEFALLINADLTATGFTGVLRLTDNRVSTGGSGLFTRLPAVYLCPSTGYPIANSVCTAPYQLYMSYVPISGVESFTVASPALVPSTLYKAVITVDRASPLPLSGVRITLSIFNYYSNGPVVSTASITSTLALDTNIYPLPVVIQYPPATADGTNLFPPANVFAGCAVFSPTPTTPSSSPTNSPSSTHMPTPKSGPKPTPKEKPGPEKSSPKKTSPKHSAVLQGLADAEELVE